MDVIFIIMKLLIEINIDKYWLIISRPRTHQLTSIEEHTRKKNPTPIAYSESKE